MSHVGTEDAGLAAEEQRLAGAVAASEAAVSAARADVLAASAAEVECRRLECEATVDERAARTWWERLRAQQPQLFAEVEAFAAHYRAEAAARGPAA